MVSSISQSAGSGLYEILRSTRNEQENLLEAAATETLTAQAVQSVNSQASNAHTAPSNMMARNFASAEREESRYTQATIQGLKVNQQMNDSKQNTLMSIMQQAKMEYENAETTGEKYKALKRAEQKINWHQQDEVRESAEETHLKESKESLEEKVKEAMAPKDGNGQPIETGISETGEAAPMPEISGSNPAPAADIAPTPAPAASVAAAPVPEVATPSPDVSAPSAPTTQSIDITV
ncbi:MAG: hypothetical protein DELT_02459 [Desulfovibrio sp.]